MPSGRSTDQKPPADSEYPLGAQTLKRLYTYMVKCRQVAQQVQAVEGRKRIRRAEAVLVGTTIGLRHDDHVAASQCEFIADIVRAAPLKPFFARMQSTKRKRPSGRADTRISVTPVVEFSIATGVALGFQLQEKHNVVVALSLGSADPSDFWREPATFAAAHKLPIVFVVQEQSSSAPQSRVADQSAQAQKCGLPGIPVDANDAVAVYRVAHEAIDRARRGAGPALIECKTWPEHAEDPIAHMRQYLEWKGLWSEDWGRKVEEDVRREIEDAVRRARSR